MASVRADSLSSARTGTAPICRICLDDEPSGLIRPCNCRGTVQYVHQNCLRTWVDTTHNTNCQICKSDYELVSSGIKNYREWKRPHPLSDAWEDRMDYQCAIVWLIFMTRVIIYTLMSGNLYDDMSIVLGTGFIRKAWWFSFCVNAIYYTAVIVCIVDQWILENTEYQFKDKHMSTGNISQRSNRVLSPRANSRSVSPKANNKKELKLD